MSVELGKCFVEINLNYLCIIGYQISWEDTDSVSCIEAFKQIKTLYSIWLIL